jgi:hypothetical protein
MASAEDVAWWRNKLGWFDLFAGVAPALAGIVMYVVVRVELGRFSTPGVYNAVVIQIIPVLLVALAVESPGTMRPRRVVQLAGKKFWLVRLAMFGIGVLRSAPLIVLTAGEARLLYSAAAGHPRASEAFVTATLAVGAAVLMLAGVRRALVAAAPPGTIERLPTAGLV